MKLRKGWEVTFEDGFKFIYTDQDYAEIPELPKWLNSSTSPLNKQRVFILSN